MTDTVKLPRMRGIKQAITEIKQADPDTALSEKALRRMILTGRLPCVRINTKYLINMEVLYKFLYGDTDPETENKTSSMKRISEKVIAL